MTFEVGCHPGATWRRADLQCHTPRDRGWQGGPELPGQCEDHEAARRAWAAEFVATCLAKGLSAIAVTDHHDLCMVDYVVAAAEQIDPTGEALVVFPGFEVTCQDNSQCLVLFCPRSDRKIWEKALSRLKGVLPAACAEAKTCIINYAKINIEDLLKEIQDDPHLRDVAVVLPHFSREDAHKSLNEPGHHPRFAQLQCDGVYIECAFADLDSVTIKKAWGELTDWGVRRRAIVATGDNRTATWDRLGHHACWIKLGENSAEALRQALLADEARISYLPPSLPAERIIEMTVLSKLMGPNPLRFTFNPGFTALIGGRGTGKSALLEYLRFALGRSDQDMSVAKPEESKRRGREAELLEDTLADGWVEVVLDRDGIRETWRRLGASRSHIEVAQRDLTRETITAAEARLRFRARPFHQKELSTTMTDRTTAADQITEIAAAEQLDERRRTDLLIENARRTLTTSLQGYASHWQAQYERKQAEHGSADLKRRLSALGERLSREGVTAENLRVIEAAPKYKRAENYFTDADRVIKADEAEITQMIAASLMVDEASYGDIFGFEECEALKIDFQAARTEIALKMAEIQAIFVSIDAKRVEANNKFNARRAAFNIDYQKAADQQTAQKALLDENARLAAELQIAEAELTKSAAHELSTRKSLSEHEQARSHLSELVMGRREILRVAADKVAERSGGMLRARVKRDPLPAEYLASLLYLLDKTRIHDVEDKCKTWVEGLIRTNAETAWRDVCDAVLTIFQEKISSGNTAELTETAATSLKKFLFAGNEAVTANQLSLVYARFNDQTVGKILSAIPRDQVILTYVDETGKTTPFEKASPGQQASALLELLLKQSAGTLIVDQPEDDLDNRVIMKIVNLIKSSKNNRQLIFATHNSNLVVNGDADKVVALGVSTSVRDGRVIGIETDGSIETDSVRQMIARIMEGGQEAFDLRGRKYRFG